MNSIRQICLRKINDLPRRVAGFLIVHIFCRTNITRGKHRYRYPYGLVVDQQDRKLFWIANHVVHTSDFNGYDYGIVKDTEFFNTIGPDCIVLSDTREYGVYWDRRDPSNHLSAASESLLLLVTRIENDNVSTGWTELQWWWLRLITSILKSNNLWPYADIFYYWGAWFGNHPFPLKPKKVRFPFPPNCQL